MVFDEETVWLTLNQVAQSFSSDKSIISNHLNIIYKERELSPEATIVFFAIVQFEACRKVKREIEYYNLDAILSVGYRVNSKQGAQFHLWANRVLKDYLMKGYAVNNRINRLEDKIERIDGKLNEIYLQLKTEELPRQGIFFDGQIYDAYAFVSDLIKKAENEIILIDNYVDESVLTMMAKRKKGVALTVYT